MQGCTELVHVRLQYFREVDEHVRRFLRPKVAVSEGAAALRPLQVAGENGIQPGWTIACLRQTM